jgi:hypothetical protein
VDVCGSAVSQALKLELEVVLNATVVTGDGAAGRAADVVAQSGVDFVFACLELEDAAQFANAVLPLRLEGVFLQDGPGLPAFSARVPGADYLFRLSQWHPSAGYVDQLLGDGAAFGQDLASAAGFLDPPGGAACAAAVAVELLHNALVRATALQVSTSFDKVMLESYAQVAVELAAVDSHTLFGQVIFDASHRNVGGSVFTTQLQPARAARRRRRALAASAAPQLQIICLFALAPAAFRALTPDAARPQLLRHGAGHLPRALARVLPVAPGSALPARLRRQHHRRRSLQSLGARAEGLCWGTRSPKTPAGGRRAPQPQHWRRHRSASARRRDSPSPPPARPTTPPCSCAPSARTCSRCRRATAATPCAT